MKTKLSSGENAENEGPLVLYISLKLAFEGCPSSMRKEHWSSPFSGTQLTQHGNAKVFA